MPSHSNLHDEGLALNILEIHHVGRSRYIILSDVGGKIQVFRENGTLHGSVIPTSTSVAFFEAKALIFYKEWCGVIRFKEHESQGI